MRTYVDGLIKLFGMPEGVLNAGRSLSAISTAFSLKSCSKCIHACMCMYLAVPSSLVQWLRAWALSSIPTCCDFEQVIISPLQCIYGLATRASA